MRFKLPLRGAGGEPVDLRRTIRSHGCVTLPPNAVLEGGTRLRLPVRLADGRRTVLELGPAPGNAVAVRASSGLRGAADRTALTAIVRTVLRLDADYTAFYARAAGDPELAWITRGAGRFLRSPTVFEDVVKTICTTNCAWSATERMTGALVADLGEPVDAGGSARLFPTPAAMAAAPESWYREVARAGYRGPYLRRIAAAVAGGELDLEALAAASPAEVDDDELERRLRALPGVGPYAAAHIMLLIGRYSRLVLDSWTRPKYTQLRGRAPRSDAAIVRRFAPYGAFAGLAFWCYVTSDWVDESAAAIAARTAPSASRS